MKKLLVMLVVAALAAPLYAEGEVLFVATDNLDGTCTVTFDANDLEEVNPVAMAIEIDVDGTDAYDLITAVSGIDGFYDIYMDHAYEDPCNYEYGDGNPIADPAAAGTVELPLHEFCISMGGLGGAEEPLNEAPDNGIAFILEAGNADDPCIPVTGVIRVNALRGGVIGDDTEAMRTNLEIPFSISKIIGDCYPEGSPGYDDWKNVLGEPQCWCLRYHCLGDTDGVFEGKAGAATRRYVVLADLKVLGNAWQKAQSDLAGDMICSDFDGLFEGKEGPLMRRIVLGDLKILGNAWQKEVQDSYFNPSCPGTEMPNG